MATLSDLNELMCILIWSGVICYECWIFSSAVFRYEFLIKIQIGPMTWSDMRSGSNSERRYTALGHVNTVVNWHTPPCSQKVGPLLLGWDIIGGWFYSSTTCPALTGSCVSMLETEPTHKLSRGGRWTEDKGVYLTWYGGCGLLNRVSLRVGCWQSQCDWPTDWELSSSGPSGFSS